MAANEQQVVAEPEPVDTQPTYTTDRNEIIKVALLGALAGILVPLIGLVIERYVINPIFCPAGTVTGICAASDLTGYYIASVLIGAVATALLANWGVFRPLLIALGATLALWGLKKYIDPLTSGSWPEYFALSAALYALSYVLFYWLLRVRNFIISVVLVVAAVILIRWALLA